MISKILSIQEKILNLIYPTVCGVCGKINQNSLCKKCELKLNKELNTHIEKKLEEKYFNELMYIFKYDGTARRMILDYKFNEKSYIYITLVKLLLKDKKIFENIKKYDTIVPVPISKKRQKERGYNQSFLIAKELGKQTGLEVVNNCLIKTKNIIEQSKLNKEERKINIQGAYKINHNELIKNKKILLIDDIYTTGSTVNECSKVLGQAKPKTIGVFTIAKD